MSAPFAILQVKVFPMTDEFCVEGVMLSREGLADFLLDRAGKEKHIQRAVKEQVFRNSPEIDEYLQRGGRITRPEPTKPKGRQSTDRLNLMTLSVDLGDLDQLIKEHTK